MPHRHEAAAGEGQARIDRLPSVKAVPPPAGLALISTRSPSATAGVVTLEHGAIAAAIRVVIVAGIGNHEVATGQPDHRRLELLIGG